METAIVTMIGGAIVASAGLMLDRRKQKARIDEVRSLLKADMSFDLECSVGFYDQLLKEWQLADPDWLATLQQLKDSNPTYCKNQEWMGLFDPLNSKVQVYDYYAASSELFDRIEQLYAELHSAIVGDVDQAVCESAQAELSDAIAQLKDCREQAVELLRAFGMEEAALAQAA
ncbi:MAG TPA: hypothetical protein ENJ65_04145 [Candidatus Tenderia electrophaga]|uniref:Uncharacterized protein n=1 Tax=Candidatus Tenderia electrophaga TaxID=1748243 RepID=A0A832J748_9GAMM|nr:hypothetical protein [Candidatus Tenderia electrophaga]